MLLKVTESKSLNLSEVAELEPASDQFVHLGKPPRREDGNSGHPWGQK